MTAKRTFANVCSISDRHVLELLPLLDLETNDPLFDGEVSSWRADLAAAKYWTGDWRNKRKQKRQSKAFAR
jgi:hypothetical protein